MGRSIIVGLGFVIDGFEDGAFQERGDAADAGLFRRETSC